MHRLVVLIKDLITKNNIVEYTFFTKPTSSDWTTSATPCARMRGWLCWMTSHASWGEWALCQGNQGLPGQFVKQHIRKKKRCLESA
jgi:hypothetical protein